MALDPEKMNPDGTWKKGVSGNPSGKPNRKEFTKLLNNTFNDETLSFLMMSKLFGLNTNAKDVKDIVNLIDHVEVKKKFRKFLRKLKVNGRIQYKNGWNKLSDKDQLGIIQWLIEFKYGKPTQQINSEISTPEDKKISIEFIKSENNES